MYKSPTDAREAAAPAEIRGVDNGSFLYDVMVSEQPSGPWFLNWILIASLLMYGLSSLLARAADHFRGAEKD